MKNDGKHSEDNKSKKIKYITIIIFIVIICGIIYYIYSTTYSQNEDVLNEITIDDTQITDTKTERMLQLEQLEEENSDIVAWIEIPDTEINYPVLQTTDNEFYMTHDYKKEYSVNGSLFLDKDFNWDIPSTNLLIYGHNNKNGTMFQTLMNYKQEEYYKEHSTIRFTTLEEDCEYEIMAVFLSRVYYKSEQNVFRYYYFINAENEEEYNEYVEQSKQASLYDTGVTAEYGEQLMTLSTCEYSQTNGRLVIVAKKITE